MATSPEGIFLDSNVLMYAAGGAHPLREPCRAAMERAVKGRTRLVISSEVLQEILHRYFSIRRPEAGRRVFRTAIELADEVLPVTGGQLERALDLLLETPGLSPRDAVHVAVMEDAGIRRILSADGHFDRVTSVERVAPAAFV